MDDIIAQFAVENPGLTIEVSCRGGLITCRVVDTDSGFLLEEVTDHPSNSPIREAIRRAG